MAVYFTENRISWVYVQSLAPHLDRIVSVMSEELDAAKILQRVRQGQEAVHSAADVRKDLGLDD